MRDKQQTERMSERKTEPKMQYFEIEESDASA